MKRAHIATGHGGRDRMIKEVNKKYANIPREVLGIYKSYCQECQKKRKRPKTQGVVVQPILTKEFASRGQVDLIDMQSMAQNSYKWIFVYQDHLTKFVVLRALTSKRAAEVAHHLLDIFLLLGAPSILQSDNGSEFTAEVIKELKIVWPRLVMVNGKPRHLQSQGSVERANGDIKDMLVVWMGDNETNDWSVGLKFVQFQKNSSLHSGIQRSPYAAMFGCEAKVGLTSSSLPIELVERMQSEDDLLSALSTSQEPVPSDNPMPTLTDESQPGTTEAPLPSTSDEAMPVLTMITPVDPESPVTEDAAPAVLLSNCIQNISNERNGASSSQMAQAERMVKRSKVVLGAGQVGDNVAVPIPIVDRGCGDPRNLLRVIVDLDENNMYTINVKAGILKGKFSRNQFDLCPQRLLTDADVDRTRTVSLQQAVSKESSSGGQGYIRCNCAGPNMCKTNRCKCFKNKIKCSSRCHGSLLCKNK